MSIQTLLEKTNCTWIDVETPTTQDLKFLEEKYSIDWLLLQDTIDKNHLPKYERNNQVQFFLARENTDIERINLSGISDISTKLGIFILPNTIITVHRMSTKTISESLSEIKNAALDLTPDQIALKLALKILQSFDDECKNLQDLLDKIESEIFLKNTPESNQIRRLYRLKRKSGLNFRLLNLSLEWVTKFNELQLKDVEISDLKDQHKDVLTDFDHLNTQVTNMISMFLALTDQKANQTMKLLAIYSVYFLPITFIAGLYGMNFENMPELHHRYGYFITLGVMATIVIVTFIYMRRKKW